MLSSSLTETLPPTSRLALAYAPTQARDTWQALLALDTRLAGVVQQAREPIIAQIRLAWWRDRLNEPPEKWPKGEPLLAALSGWGERAKHLTALVDGWEALLGEPPLDVSAFVTFAEGRGAACVALAGFLGVPSPNVARLGQGWGLGDLASLVGAEPISTSMSAHDWRPARLPRALRPLVVLHGLARRTHRGRSGDGPAALLTAIRLGIMGF